MKSLTTLLVCVFFVCIEGCNYSSKDNDKTPPVQSVPLVPPVPQPKHDIAPEVIPQTNFEELKDSEVNSLPETNSQTEETESQEETESEMEEAKETELEVETPRVLELLSILEPEPEPEMEIETEMEVESEPVEEEEVRVELDEDKDSKTESMAVLEPVSILEPSKDETDLEVVKDSEVNSLSETNSQTKETESEVETPRVLELLPISETNEGEVEAGSNEEKELKEEPMAVLEIVSPSVPNKDEEESSEEKSLGDYTQEGFYKIATTDTFPFDNVIADRISKTFLIHAGVPSESWVNSLNDEHQFHMRRVVCQSTPLTCDENDKTTWTFTDLPWRDVGTNNLVVGSYVQGLFINGSLQNGSVIGFPSPTILEKVLGLLSPMDAKMCAGQIFYEDENYYDNLIENGYMDDTIFISAAGNYGARTVDGMEYEFRGAFADIKFECTKKLILKLQEKGAFMYAAGFRLPETHSSHNYPEPVAADYISQRCESEMQWCVYFPIKFHDTPSGTSTSTAFAVSNVGLIRALYPSLTRLDVKDLTLACSGEVFDSHKNLPENGRSFSTNCLAKKDEQGNHTLLNNIEVQELISSYRKSKEAKEVKEE